MDYPKSVPNVGLVNGKFVDENTTTGQVGSLIPASWGNAVTDELLSVIRAGGKNPEENNNGQLLGAIDSIVKTAIPPVENRTTLADYGINDAYTKSYTDGELSKCIKLGQKISAYSNPTFNSNSSYSIASIPGHTGAMEINGGTGEASAVIAFHRPGSFASYFGLDTDNQFKVGGWSMGNVAHTIWHSGNRPRDTASLSPAGWSKNADTGEIIQWVEVPVGDFSFGRLVNVTWPFQFPTKFLHAIISFRQASSSGSFCGQTVYSSGNQTGCTLRMEEWAGANQDGLTVIVTARGL